MVKDFIKGTTFEIHMLLCKHMGVNYSAAIWILLHLISTATQYFETDYLGTQQ